MTLSLSKYRCGVHRFLCTTNKVRPPIHANSSDRKCSPLSGNNYECQTPNCRMPGEPASIGMAGFTQPLNLMLPGKRNDTEECLFFLGVKFMEPVSPLAEILRFSPATQTNGTNPKTSFIYISRRGSKSQYRAPSFFQRSIPEGGYQISKYRELRSVPTIDVVFVKGRCIGKP